MPRDDSSCFGIDFRHENHSNPAMNQIYQDTLSMSFPADKTPGKSAKEQTSRTIYGMI
jgi:hypothetical protein